MNDEKSSTAVENLSRGMTIIQSCWFVWNFAQNGWLILYEISLNFIQNSKFSKFWWVLLTLLTVRWFWIIFLSFKLFYWLPFPLIQTNCQMPKIHFLFTQRMKFQNRFYYFLWNRKKGQTLLYFKKHNWAHSAPEIGKNYEITIHLWKKHLWWLKGNQMNFFADLFAIDDYFLLKWTVFNCQNQFPFVVVDNRPYQKKIYIYYRWISEKIHLVPNATMDEYFFWGGFILEIYLSGSRC
jgi:hypothetical protein